MKKYVVQIVFAAAFLLLIANPAWATPGGYKQMKPQDCTLDKLAKNPDAFLNTRLKITCQFESYGKFFNPVYTRFVSDEYINLCAWDDTKNLWEKEDFTNVFCFLFVSKTEKCLLEALQLKRFDRFEATAVVRSCFNDIAWVEVTEIRILGEKLNKDTLKRISTAMRLVKEELYSSAYNEFYLLERNDEIPERIRMLITKSRGISAYHVQKYTQARRLLQKAYKYFPQDNEVEDYLEKAIQAEALENNQ